VFASSPSSAGANYYAGVGAYDEMSPPPSSASAYSDSTLYGDAAFPPSQTQHYPLDMAPASAYAPHLLRQASLLMHPHAYELQAQSQGQAPQLHGLSPLHGHSHPLPGMQGPPLQLHALQMQGLPPLYTVPVPVPAPTRRRERPRPEERPPRPPKRRIGYYPASPLVSE
jgi:hypothetical protein